MGNGDSGGGRCPGARVEDDKLKASAHWRTDKVMPPFAMTDESYLRILEECTPEAISSNEQYVYNEYTKLLARALQPRSVLNHIQLCSYISECHSLIKRELQRSASFYSSLSWLWYLRRLPPSVFSGELPTTLGYDAQLAETLSGLYGAAGSDSPRTTDVLRYEVNRSTVRRILRFAHGARYLSTLHGQYRRAGKGQPFSFGPGDPIPDFDESGPEEEAISLFDRRMSEPHGTLSRTGTSLNTTLKSIQESDFENIILMVFRLAAPTLTPSFVQNDAGEKREVTVMASFGPTFQTLDNLRQLNEEVARFGFAPWPRSIAAILFLLRLAIYLMLYGHSSFSKALEYGYVVTDRSSLLEVASSSQSGILHFLAHVMPGADLPESFGDVLRILNEEKGQVWPLKPGTLLREDKGFLCIDLHGASMLLNAALEYPRIGGQIGQVRGSHFEDMVQDMIASTPWKPQDELLAIRSRPLRIFSIDITDIDAIAENEASLILISCKSFVYSSDYDKGKHSAVRNISERIQEAVMEWNDKIERLRSHKKGDNYDFAKYQNITGVVCTPSSLFVPIGIATEMVLPGLRICSSVNELKDWLNRTDTEMNETTITE